jgi:hypothetical protein
MENLLSIYDAQENCDPVREIFETTHPKTILEELSDILQLRGRLQQMGATFSDNGELLTYGDPSSPLEFEAMVRLGPLYDEQWSAFFVDNYVPPDHGSTDKQLWSGLRTLKKLLRNEGVVFGRQHQRYSFGNSSTKLQRLCCAYDELRNEWLAILRTSLPAHDDAQLVTLLEEDSSSEDDSGFGDDDIQKTEGTVLLDMNESHDIAGLPPMLHHRSSSTPHTIGWRFSDESTPPRPKDENWRFSDGISSTPKDNMQTEEVTKAILVQKTSKNDTKSKKLGKIRRWFRHAFGRG